MRVAYCLLLISCVVCTVAAHARQSDGVCYVAPEGNDAWSGGLARANSARTDGPVRTLHHALEVIRNQRTRPAQKANGGFVIKLASGTYPLSETLALSEVDSGTPQSPLMIEAAEKQTPLLSGGVRIMGWKRTSGNRWETTLPQVQAGQWYFSQLYVNGERRYRPRFSQPGYAFIASEMPSTPAMVGKGFDRFRFKVGDIRADWHNRADVEIIPFLVWTSSRFHIADVNESEHVVTLTGGMRDTAPYSRLATKKRYLAENVYESLSEPGQWYLDRQTGVLTYLAKPGEDPNKDTVIAPRLEKLLTLNGAHNITVRGIQFAHTAWNLPGNGHSSAQADINVPSAIEAENTRDCVFENCVVRNTGGWAIDLKPGTQRCQIANCELTDLGAGGVKIGGTTNASEEQRASHNTVRDCLIAEGGRVHPAAVGVWIGHSPYNTIEHNEIVDFYYTGVSVGWSWGYNPSGAHHNTISYNHIHQIGQGVLSDMGGIYTLGLSPGTVLDHNKIHDIESIEYGGWGIYFDEGTTEASANNNIVYNTRSAPFHQHYGTKNRVENNVFAFGQEAQWMRSRADNGPGASPEIQSAPSFTLRHNLVYYKQGPLLGSNWSGTNFALEDNLYWNTTGPVTFPGGISLSEWQAKEHDAGSVIADPQFINPEKEDFGLRSGSPALRLGFIPIDLASVGRRTGKPYKNEAPRAFPPPPAPVAITENFEDAEPGSRPSGDLTLLEEAAFPTATARITEETAASGQRSLKVTDAAGQQFSYSPHLFAQPRFTEGVLLGRFALRVEPGAVIVHEWRDASNPYAVGPSLTVDGKGGLFAGKTQIADLPLGRWIAFEIRCPIGPTATGQYDLTVKLPGRTPPQRFTALPCGSGKAFQSLRWWGFISNATTPTTFYLDNLFIGPEYQAPR